MHVYWNNLFIKINKFKINLILKFYNSILKIILNSYQKKIKTNSKILFHSKIIKKLKKYKKSQDYSIQKIKSYFRLKFFFFSSFFSFSFFLLIFLKNNFLKNNFNVYLTYKIPFFPPSFSNSNLSKRKFNTIFIKNIFINFRIFFK